MRRLGPLLTLIALFAAPASARAQTIFTIAGAGTSHLLDEGERATSADLDSSAPVAVLPDGDVLIGSDEVVWRLGRDGRLRRAAGNGEPGDDGDGGPALRATLWVDDLAALPDGGFLVADAEDGRIRRVDAQGTITTVAGGGRLRGNGVPARQAQAGEPFEVAADPRGGFVFADGFTRLRRVTPDGRIHTIAGTGGYPDGAPDLHGQPATSVPMDVSDLAVAPDGSVLLIDGLGRIDRVAPDGAITVALERPGLDFEPTGIAALPGGGFLVADRPLEPSPRIWRVGPEGTMTPLAGGGPLKLTAPAGLAQRLDGGPAAEAVLNDPGGIAVAPDGGAVFSDTIEEGGHYGALVRYVAPAAPGRLAVALQRDARRILRPRTAVGVSLTQPATVALTVAGRTTTAALPAGASELALPPGLPRSRPLMVHLAAAGAAGARAYDRARVYPRGWLPSEIARLVTDGLRREALPDVCRRFGPRRVDCRRDANAAGCAVTSVRLAGHRLRWGRYGCRFASRPRFRRRPHALRRTEWTCVFDADMCPPGIVGRVDEAQLLPSD